MRPIATNIGFAVASCVATMAQAHLASRQGSSDPPVEQFKRFLSSPPVIERLVFGERLPPDPKAPWRTDLPLSSSQSFQYYHARWQSNAHFLREIASPHAVDDLQAIGLLASCFEDRCWFRYGDAAYDGRIEFGVSLTNMVCSTAFRSSFPLLQVLNLGIMHARIGSAEWEGNRFRIRETTRPFDITGELSLGASGLVDRSSSEILQRHARHPLAQSLWLRYERSLSFFPRTVSCSWLNGKEAIPRIDLIVHSLHATNLPSPPEAFDCTEIARSNLFQVDEIAVDETGEGRLLSMICFWLYAWLWENAGGLYVD
jgi:hypothetical protein